MTSKKAMVDDRGFSPRVVGFLCNWCSYAGADLAGTSRLDVPAALSPIRVMCSSRVDPLLIMTALMRGADGVLVAGCHPGDCHYDKGNYYARRRFALTEQILRTLDLEPERVRLSWVSASEGPRYAEVVNEFIEEVRQLGPNPMRTGRCF